MVRASAQAKKRIARIIYGTIICILLIAAGFLIINFASQKETMPKVIASNFVGYDFARAVIGDDTEIAMLLKPGGEIHDFEPTPEDVIKIKNADLFIYVGGESDEWAQELLEDNEIPVSKTLRLMDYVETKKEAGEDEDDEHIWTSPVNAIKLVDAIRSRLSEIYPDKAEQFAANAVSYTDRLTEIDARIRQVVAESPKKELIFGDRFPFQYFVDEYGLDYSAAFPGCAEQTEASANTIAFLVDKARKDGINVIMKIELSSDQLAKTIADEVGAKVLTLNSAHNISREDFEAGVTYADIMEGNVEVLKEALK